MDVKGVLLTVCVVVENPCPILEAALKRFTELRSPKFW
jgi:hypothetical protein